MNEWIKQLDNATLYNSQTFFLSLSPISTGGYYLTTLYASLYYISSFQPRLPARQLSVEAQKSLNQWHRRRTLHCNQSRRSKHRRTIRRLTRVAQNLESERTEDSGKESDSVNTAASQRQTEGTTEDLQETSSERGAEDKSQTSAPASDCNHSDRVRKKQDEGLTLCTVGEENHIGLWLREDEGWTWEAKNNNLLTTPFLTI